jgi:hypothetical protein
MNISIEIQYEIKTHHKFLALHWKIKLHSEEQKVPLRVVSWSVLQFPKTQLRILQAKLL